MYETVEEFEARKLNFKNIMADIEAQNAKFARGESSYKAGLNHLSDYHPEEFQKMLGITEMPQVSETKWTGAPNSDGVDWRDDKRGVVTPVKDQGQCGSCWAFSATETTESSWVIAGNDQVIMSPQELVDCAKGMFSNHGCSGGWYYYAWKWNKKHETMT